VAELRPGELDAVAAAYWATADPANRAADEIWWNWCRMPAGLSGDAAAASTVTLFSGAARQLPEWLGREPELTPTGIQAADALRGTLGA